MESDGTGSDGLGGLGEVSGVWGSLAHAISGNYHHPCNAPVTIRASRLGLPGQQPFSGVVVDAGSFIGLEGLLGEARFARYLNRYGGDRVLALRLYTWNLAASSALWGPINVIEVAVRNAIHGRLIERTGRGDWWNDAHVHLCRSEEAAIDSAIATLVRRGTSAPTSDQVVAATSFGLWVGLTGAGIARDRRYDYETTLWQPRLQHAFPHRGERRRKLIHAKLDRIRVLRNRIAHHEPIYRSPLGSLHRDMLEIGGMIHPDARGYIETYARASEVIDGMKEAVTLGAVRVLSRVRSVVR